MSVRAKFKVSRIEITQNGNEELRSVILNPVYGNGDPEHENTKFFKWTPSGEIRLGTINEYAWKQFEIGKEFYVDFTLAEVKE